VINGEKRFIDFAPYADFYFTPVRTSGEDGDREGVSIIVIDRDTDGIELLQDQSDWHGFRGLERRGCSSTTSACPRPTSWGTRARRGRTSPTTSSHLEHLTVARYCLGASQQALEIAANYTANREVNERPVSRYQAVNHKVAEMVTKLDGAYLLNTRAARIMDDRGVSAGRMESAMAKWLGNELAHEIADTCIQIMGGIGTTTSYPVEQTQRDVRAGRFMGGATEVMKSVVQHDAYQLLLDEEFDADFVGNEREGSLVDRRRAAGPDSGRVAPPNLTADGSKRSIAPFARENSGLRTVTPKRRLVDSPRPITRRARSTGRRVRSSTGAPPRAGRRTRQRGPTDSSRLLSSAIDPVRDR